MLSLTLLVAAILAGGDDDWAPSRVKDLEAERTTWRSVGPGGGGWIECVQWSRHKRDRFFVGCDVGGFYISEDGGRHYEMRNRGLTHPFIDAILEHPTNPDILFVATRGGIFKSENRGRLWREVRTGLPPHRGSEFSVQFTCLAFQPGSTRTLFAATGQSRHRSEKFSRGEIWRSDDVGESWQMVRRSGLAKEVDIRDLAFDAKNPERMLVSTTRGLFRSENGGVDWTPSNEGLPAHKRTMFLAWSPSDPQIVYVSLMQVSGEPWAAGVYRSDDGGRTWAPRNGGIEQHVGKPGESEEFSTWMRRIAIDPKNPDIVWAGGGSWVYASVFRTTDGGLSWQNVFPDREKGWINLCGKSVFSFSLSPLDPGRVAMGNSMIVQVTEDNARSWQQRYTAEREDGLVSGVGLEVTCLHTIQPSRHIPNRFYLGYYDIGLFRTDDGGKSLRRLMKGVPYDFSNSCHTLAEAPDDPNVLWAGFGAWHTDKGLLMKSVDAGQNWTPCTNGLPTTVVRSVHVTGRAPNRRVLIATGKGLFVSRDDGTTWRAFDKAVFPAAERVRLLTAGPDRIVFATAGTDEIEPAVWALEKGAKTVRRLTPENLKMGTIRGLSIEGDRILVAADEQWMPKAGYLRQGGAFLSTDRGATWSRVFSSNRCKSAVVSNGELFVGLHDLYYHDDCIGGGVIRSTDDGRTWKRLDGQGLGSWNATVLAINPFDKRELWLGTGGCSVFVTHLQ